MSNRGGWIEVGDDGQGNSVPFLHFNDGSQSRQLQLQDTVNALDFGMVADTRTITDVTLNSGTPATIASPSLVASDAGKVIQIESRAAPATGTVATVAGGAIAGTVTTEIGSPILVGLGTSFTSALFVGQLIKVGGVVAKVRIITSDTVVHANQADWASSAGGQALTTYYVAGSGTAFLSQLFEGQGLFIGSTFCNVLAIGDDARVCVWPPPTSSVAGQTLYRNPVIAAHILSVDVAGHTATLATDRSSDVAISGSGVTAHIGTDNDGPCAAFQNAAALSQKRKEIPGAASHYMFWNGPRALNDSDRGLLTFGHGWGSISSNYYGTYDWLRLPPAGGNAGTVLRIANGAGHGFVIDSDACYQVRFEKMALIGPGYGGTSRGMGMLPGREATLSAGISVRREVALFNWAYGYDAYKTFSDYADNMRVIGNCTGLRFNSVTTQKWVNLQASINRVAVHLKDIETATFSGTSEGNLEHAYLFNQANSIELDQVYCENSPSNTDANFAGRGDSFHFDTTGALVIQAITFSKVHSGDVYCEEMVGDGTVTGIFDIGCNFKAMSLRPTWQFWGPADGKFSHVDLTLFPGGLSTMGGGAIHGAVDVPVIVQQSISGTITPDVTDGDHHLYLVTGNVIINAPTVNGHAFSGLLPSGTPYFQQIFHIRNAGTFTITFNGYATVPWLDVGATAAGGGGGVAVIGFRHSGGGGWECFLYTPYTKALQTYTTTNHTDRRALDETGATLVQVANTLGTLIKDLRAQGIVL